MGGGEGTNSKEDSDNEDAMICLAFEGNEHEANKMGKRKQSFI